MATEITIDPADTSKPEQSSDIPSFAMDALTSIKSKRTTSKNGNENNYKQNGIVDYHTFLDDDDDDGDNDECGLQSRFDHHLPSQSLHIRASATMNKTSSLDLFNAVPTPQYETFETTFADINDSEDEFLDDDEVDDDDYEYNTDEDWKSDDTENDDDDDDDEYNKNIKPVFIEQETRPVARSVTFAPTTASYKKPAIAIQPHSINDIPSPQNITNKAKSYGSSLKDYHHFKIRSVTIYGNLMLGDFHKNDYIENTQNKKLKKYRTKNEKNSPMINNLKKNDDIKKNNDDDNDNDDDDDDDDEIETKRNFIKKEIIDTEVSYLKGLQCLMNEFIKPIFEQKLIPKKYEKTVTSIIPMIIKFHMEFLEELNNEYDRGKDGNIGSVFIKCAAFLKMYIDYIRQYQSILDIFAKHNKSKKLKKYLKIKRKQRKPLTNHLILPIQRVPRYMLLLEDLKKKTPSNHANYSTLSQALNIINNVANSINERKREIENMSQCLQVMENLRELNRNIVEPHRKFLNQFLFRKKDNQRPREFFVFSDLIIICNLKMKVKMILEMRTLELKQGNSLNIPSALKRKSNDPMIQQKLKENNISMAKENEFTLYTARGKPVEYETDIDKIGDVLELNELIIKSRLAVWDGDLSRLDDGKSETRSALKKCGVSQAQQYRNQLETLQRLKEKKDQSTINMFKKSSSIKGKKNKVLEMLGADQ